MRSLFVVDNDEGIDLSLQLGDSCWRLLLCQVLLQCLLPTLNFALGLGMIGRSAHMGHALLIEPFGEIAGYVAGTIVAQEARLVPDVGLVAA